MTFSVNNKLRVLFDYRSRVHCTSRQQRAPHPIKSETCVSLGIEDTQRNSQLTGISSFMNCVGVGNAFLVFNLQATKSFFRKHSLKLDRIYNMPSMSREILIDALKEYGGQLHKHPITIGGIVLDTARIAQWMLPQPKSVVFLGAQAKDEDALTVIELCKMTRLGVRMEEIDKTRTSILLVLHVKKRWCEILFTDKMPHISTSYIDRPVVTKVFERANIIFTSVLSILLMPQVNKMLAYFSFSRFKHFVIILDHSEFLIDAKDAIINILCYTDVVFLTPKAAEKFVEVFKVPFFVMTTRQNCTLGHVCSVSLSKWRRCCRKSRLAWDIHLWLKGLAQKSCTLVMSDGLEVAYVYTDLYCTMSSKYKSKYVKSAKIVSSYGSASAFVAGFMAMMIGGFQIDPCVDCGFFCTSLVVSKLGLILPEDRAAVLLRWQTILDKIMIKNKIDLDLAKRVSNMPFTIFQTPWKEYDVNAVFTDIVTPNNSDNSAV